MAGVAFGANLQQLVESPQPLLEALSRVTTSGDVRQSSLSLSLSSSSSSATAVTLAAKDSKVSHRPKKFLSPPSPSTSGDESTGTNNTGGGSSGGGASSALKRKRGRPPKSRSEPVDPAVMMKKKDRRREKNREAAQRSRERKRLKIDELEAKIESVEQENQRLRELVARLEQERGTFKDLLLLPGPSAAAAATAAAVAAGVAQQQQQTSLACSMGSMGSMGSISSPASPFSDCLDQKSVVSSPGSSSDDLMSMESGHLTAASGGAAPDEALQLVGGTLVGDVDGACQQALENTRDSAVEAFSFVGLFAPGPSPADALPACAFDLPAFHGLPQSALHPTDCAFDPSFFPLEPALLPAGPLSPLPPLPSFM